MPRILLPTVALTFLLTAATLQAQTPTLPDLAAQALSEDPASSTPAIQQLRAAAYPGLNAILALRPTTADAAAIARWHHAVDQVGMQKDAHASRLYWYTDLTAATAEAQRAHKPILSLRLLGNLNDDLSCANSRFFRTTLYPNAAVGNYLRDHVILHWQSVRPVPVVTIDMGDGRTLTRTITGNSIHYLLDPHARLVDALPGLYGANAFLADLKSAEVQALQSASQDDATFARTEQAYALATAGRLRESLQSDLKKIHSTLTPDTLDDATWQKIAALHRQDAMLDRAARTLITAKVPIEKAMPLARSKMAVETPLMRMLATLETSIVRDTVKNEYDLRPTLLTWLSQAATPVNLPVFNDKIYADLFLTPNTDPWLGLSPPDIYSALDNDGQKVASASRR